MITMNKAILHVLDHSSNIGIFSTELMDAEEEVVFNFLSKHINKAVSDANASLGTFYENSEFKEKLVQYVNQELTLQEFSQQIGERLHDLLGKSGEENATDFIVVDCVVDETPYFGMLICKNKTGYTHQVTQLEGIVRNDVIKHYGLLPGQKADCYAFVNLNTYEVRFVDKIRDVEAEAIMILPSSILHCTIGVSEKETVKTVNKIVDKIAEDHGENNALAVSKAKNFLMENAAVAEDFEPTEMSKEIFSSPVMQREFVEAVQKAGVPEVVKVEQGFAMKASQVHKIKTDTGIEISYPVDYYKNPEFIEFVNNPDGTISINLKNIGRIINK